MKAFFLILFPMTLLCAALAGCSDGGPTTSTTGADVDAIAEYEAAVAAMEKQDVDSGLGEEAE